MNSKIPVEKKPTFSFSQLDTFLTCPKKYRYAYVLRLPTQPHHAFSFGTSIHTTLHDFFAEIIRHRDEPGLFDGKISEGFLLELFAKNWVQIGYLSPEHAAGAKSRGEEMLRDFFRAGDFGHPLFLERKFAIERDEFKITGRFDRIDAVDSENSKSKKVEVIDYKTGKSVDAEKAAKNLQLAIYALGVIEDLKMTPEKLTLVFVADGKRVSIAKSEKDLKKDEAKITGTIQKIRAGDFAATPGKFACPHCDFRTICEDAVG